MLQAAAAGSASNTELTQLASGRASRPPARQRKTGRSPKGTRVTGEERESVRQPDRPVIEMEHGITVYPPEAAREPWRAVFVENGARRFRQGATEAKLAEELEKVRERLAVEACNMDRPGADLIAHYLNPERLPVEDRWSRKHAYTQRRLCERFAAPIIAALTCQDIKTTHMQLIVNAAPTAGEGARVARMLSALVNAGIDAGYLANPRLARVHWQPGERPLPAAPVSVAGESALWVDPAEIPASADVDRLSKVRLTRSSGSTERQPRASARISVAVAAVMLCSSSAIRADNRVSSRPMMVASLVAPARPARGSRRARHRPRGAGRRWCGRRLPVVGTTEHDSVHGVARQAQPIGGFDIDLATQRLEHSS